MGRFRRPFLVLSLAAILLTGACRTGSKPANQARQVGWLPIVKFSGAGSSQTDSFDISSGEWRIKWSATNEKPPGAGTLKITVHSEISGRPLMVALDQKGAGHGIAYINEDPRLYHLVVDSTGVDWNLSDRNKPKSAIDPIYGWGAGGAGGLVAVFGPRPSAIKDCADNLPVGVSFWSVWYWRSASMDSASQTPVGSDLRYPFVTQSLLNFLVAVGGGGQLTGLP